MCDLDDRDDSGYLVALMIDVDHFKTIDDSFGHPTGDRVLLHVARSIQNVVRPGDIVVRFGGEEFLVLLSSVKKDEATEIAERVRRSVAEQDLNAPSVSVSVGVAFRGSHEAYNSLIARADAALYRAKLAGRDRVDLAPDLPTIVTVPHEEHNTRQP